MEKLVKISIGDVVLEGNLALPGSPKGLVLFAHGSGSSRLSPRNTFVAGVLQKAGIATLLFDLLTEKEDQIYENRFDIPCWQRGWQGLPGGPWRKKRFRV